MGSVLRQMVSMDEGKIRLIAITTTMKGQLGLDLNKTYQVPVLRDSEITGYELAAWCYCSFMEVFPQMKDKLQMPYASHYEKAMASDELTEAEQEQARQTFQKLEGTNMERVLQASVLGSSDKLKRYMRLYVDRGEPHLLTGKNRDDILREFDIREHVPE
jgi:hypothetical protein